MGEENQAILKAGLVMNLETISFVLLMLVMFFTALYLLLLKQLAILNRKVAQVGSFFAQLRSGSFTGGVETAGSKKLYFDPAWKSDRYNFREILLTSGTKWSCDPCGCWHLLEAYNLKKEVAVRELLECFGFPGRFLVEGGVKEGVYVARLITLLDLGLGIPVEYLHCTAQTERTKSNIDTSFFAKKNCTETSDAD